MAILKVLTYPDERLFQKTRLVSQEELVSPEFERQVIDVIETLEACKVGAALAANQVGIGLRFFVVTLHNSCMGHSIFVNPTIEWLCSDKSIHPREGCLSFPDVFLEKERSQQAIVSYSSLSGRRHTVLVEDFIARIWQHECEHLDGKTFIDDEPERRKWQVKFKLSKKETL